MTYLLAQDIGTSSAKAALFTSDGVLVRSCSSFYEVQRPAPNWAQQNAEVWWDAFCENNHKLLDVVTVKLLCDHAGCAASHEGIKDNAVFRASGKQTGFNQFTQPPFWFRISLDRL